MIQVGTLFPNISEEKMGKTLSERAMLIKEFTDHINTERQGTKYKAISGRLVAIKTSHLSLSDLYYFLSVCKDYKNRNGSFSKCFFGGLKVRNE